MEDCLYKCDINVVPPKAWRSALTGWFGSVEQLIGHFSIREEFTSMLSAWPVPSCCGLAGIKFTACLY